MDAPGMSPLRCGSMTLPCFGFSLGFLANEGEASGVIAVYVCSISTFSCGGSLIFCGLLLQSKEHNIISTSDSPVGWDL